MDEEQIVEGEGGKKLPSFINSPSLHHHYTTYVHVYFVGLAGRQSAIFLHLPYPRRAFHYNQPQSVIVSNTQPRLSQLKNEEGGKDERDENKKKKETNIQIGDGAFDPCMG